MNIDLSKVPIIWYENKEGERWLPKLDGAGHPEEGRPDDFIYQHSQFPTNLRHNILKIIQPDEVAACDHPLKDIRPTGGWIDGVFGRECRTCNGTQIVEIPGRAPENQPGLEAWPKEWDATGSRSIGAGEIGWSEDLVLAMVTAKTRPPDHPAMRLGQAILVVANSCERCMNTLANQYGLDWGYEYMSEDWKKCGTICMFCEGDGHERVPLEPGDPNYAVPSEAGVGAADPG